MTQHFDDQGEYLAFLSGVQAGSMALAADTLNGWVERMQWALDAADGDYQVAYEDTLAWVKRARDEGRRRHAKAVRAAERKASK